MDTLQVERSTSGAALRLPFRLRQVAPADPDAMQAAASQAAAVGFDALLLPCPYATEHGLPADATRAAECYGGGPIGTVAPLLERMRADCGLSLIVDLPVGVVAAGSSLHLAAPDLFIPIDQAGRLDPRVPLELDRARVRLDDPDAIDAYAATLSDVVTGLRGAGIDGLCLRELSKLPGATIARLFARLRRSDAGAILIGDTQGVAWRELDRIDRGLFDYVIASSAWWNRRDEWFYDELDHLRRLAPPLIPASTADATARDEDRAARDLGLAAALGAGWIVPASAPILGLAAVNRIFGQQQAASCMACAGVAHLNGTHGPVLATLRTATPDPRAAASAFLSLLNTDPSRSAPIDPAEFLPAVGGMFGPFSPVSDDSADPLVPGVALTLQPGEFALFAADAAPAPPRTKLTAAEVADYARSHGRLAIEAASPAVDAGAFPVKRLAGETVTVSADIICDGHDKLGAVLQWRAPDSEAWQETRLQSLGNDRWQAAFPLTAIGLHHYRIAAWRDAFATFRDELAKKHQAAVPTSLELREGALLVERTLPPGAPLRTALDAAASEDERRDILLADGTAAIMRDADPRPFAVASDAIPVSAERTASSFAAWYEVFPRSLSDDPGRHGTFRDVERHLPRIKAMGFDVLYFPPIHPIGRINRKGPNNTLTPADSDPGSPYAIGAAEGGHTALHPELGTFEDFRHLRDAALENGLELAIDFAIQCSPDHPWLREHKAWFNWRPDGSIRYAENPPKKYQDIVNVDFYADGAIPDLWLELANVVLFWCEQGVRLFRVDNPHTKSFAFWQWMIQAVRARYPDAAFLAEAFTRPKIMARLAKIGFSQSYTYFTWRNAKSELQEYLTELADGAMRDFFRPHFFVNTPDINPFFLQTSGRPGFLIRAALAALLSGLWGVYNGFELCEATPLGPGKEEYLDSEKFQLRAWDWDRPGNIAAEITRLNAIRRANPALQTHLNVSFLPAANDAVLFFEKATPGRSNVVLVAISIDPFNTQSASIELPLYKYGLPDTAGLDLHDLLADQRFRLTGKYQSVTLTPDRPYAIWRLA